MWRMVNSEYMESQFGAQFGLNSRSVGTYWNQQLDNVSVEEWPPLWRVVRPV